MLFRSEKMGQRGCFGLQVKSCLGACVGKEDRHEHDQRLFTALTDLKVHAWPYSGAVDLIEQSGDWIQRHRLEDWRYMGTWCSRTRQNTPHGNHGFDLDTYKILTRFLEQKHHGLEIIPLGRSTARQLALEFEEAA